MSIKHNHQLAYSVGKVMQTEKLLVALDTSDQVKHLQENTIQRMVFNFILVTVDRIGIVA